MGRSIAGVVAGFFFVIASLTASQSVLWLVDQAAFVAPGEDEGPSAGEPAMLLLVVALSVPCGLLGGYIASYVAGQREVLHGLAVAVPVSALLTLSTFVAEAGLAPLWYQASLPFFAAVSAVLGGYLRAWTKRALPG